MGANAGDKGLQVDRRLPKELHSDRHGGEEGKGEGEVRYLPGILEAHDVRAELRSYYCIDCSVSFSKDFLNEHSGHKFKTIFLAST